MAQFAGGYLRVTVRKRNGDRIRSSELVDYTVYDNKASPRVVMNARHLATANDQAEEFPELVHGSVGEYLTVDLSHTAAVTLATANCVVEIPYKAFSLDPKTKQKVTDTRMLRIGDRIIKAGSTATNDPRGINDNKVSVANEATAVIAFAPAAMGENVRLGGFLYLFIDGA
jgi:hypothetical protein